jgi:lipopolysaccharide biosynthesis glycosyltransferase
MWAMTYDFEENAIQVALASDRNYVLPLSVAICSAAANSDRRRPIVFHVIQNGIEPQLRARVERSLENCGFPDARIHWISIELHHLADLKVANAYLNVLAYARLLIPDLLPSNVTKVLYLDSDVVVRGDLAELWDMELGPKALLAVRDLIAWVGAPRGIATYRELGIPAEANYFNSGVLLMNLKKWREEHVSSRVFDYVRNNRATIQMEDQEGLNAILFDDWGELAFRWNWQIPWRTFRLGRKTMPWKPDDETKNIIHFTTEEKPWLPGCDVKEKRDFFYYLDKTDWAGWRVPLAREIQGRLLRVLDDFRAVAGSVRRRTLRVMKVIE